MLTLRFVTSVRDGGDWSASRPCRFATGERTPGTNWLGGYTLLRREELTPPGIEPMSSSPMNMTQ
jgi:hypothetical protein